VPGKLNLLRECIATFSEKVDWISLYIIVLCLPLRIGLAIEGLGRTADAVVFFNYSPLNGYKSFDLFSISDRDELTLSLVRRNAGLNTLKKLSFRRLGEIFLF